MRFTFHVNRLKIFDLKTVKKERAVTSQSKVSKSDSATFVFYLIHEDFGSLFFKDAS